MCTFTHTINQHKQMPFPADAEVWGAGNTEIEENIQN